MFKSLKFATKIGLLPTLAGVSFLTILTVLLVTGQQSSEMLVNIQQGYYSSLELNRKLAKDLSEIHASFQDAASMADPEYASNAESFRRQYIATLARGQRNRIVDIEPLITLQDEFESYYELATTTIQSIVDGTGDMSAYSNLQLMSRSFDKMLNDINLLTTRDKQNVTNAIADAQTRQSRVTMVLTVIAATSLLLLIGSSIFIIRTASQSVNTTVEGINALASGDFSREFQATTGDEMGEMVRRVTHVTQTVNSVTDEIEGLTASIRDGQLQVRGESGKFEGAYARLVDNINDLIEAFVAPIEVTADYVERISHGDIPPPIEGEYRGDFNKTKENLNTLAHTMRDLVDEVAGMTSAAKAGDLERRGRPEAFSGAWSDLVDGINDTLDAVTRPLQEVSQAMSAMARGDLTYKSDVRYEGAFAKLQSDMNLTVGKLTDVIDSIKESGDAAAAVASELSAGNHSLRQRTDAQASSLQETAKAMSEMTVALKQNADSAQRAKERVSETSDKARKGGAVVQKAVSAMDGVNAASAQISDIINVIDEIAFQTNLLALNAAVEAARAGEEGKGFAVVASEVRNLAGRSATAAKEISDLIQDTVNKVEEGSRLVHESGQTLNEIVDAVIDVDDMVAQISESSQTQVMNIDNVSETVSLMDSMTKKNAELADAVVQSSTSMGEEAKRLNRMTAFFVTQTGEGSGHGEAGNEPEFDSDTGVDASGTAA